MDHNEETSSAEIEGVVLLSISSLVVCILLCFVPVTYPPYVVVGSQAATGACVAMVVFVCFGIAGFPTRDPLTGLRRRIDRRTFRFLEAHPEQSLVR
jgi:hypothetical protein